MHGRGSGSVQELVSCWLKLVHGSSHGRTQLLFCCRQQKLSMTWEMCLRSGDGVVQQA